MHRRGLEQKPGWTGVWLVQMVARTGCLDEKGAKMVDWNLAILSYSDGSVKEVGTIGSGAWHVLGHSMQYSHREYPGMRRLSSARAELLYTLRCMFAIRDSGWTVYIHHRIDNEGVVRRYKQLGRHKIATGADVDLGGGETLPGGMGR